MKRLLSIILQFILYLLAFAAGSVLLPALHLLPALSFRIGPGRVFVYDGILLMLAFYALILLIATARKRIPAALANATLAWVLAFAVGLFYLKFGFKSV
jgi:hypothetical protein